MIDYQTESENDKKILLQVLQLNLASSISDTTSRPSIQTLPGGVDFGLEPHHKSLEISQPLVLHYSCVEMENIIPEDSGQGQI